MPLSSRAKRVLLLVEAAVCFGPVAVICALGVFLVPLWTVTLLVEASGLVPTHAPEGPFVIVVSALFVMLGLAGLTGVVRTVLALSGDYVHAGDRRLTGLLILLGVAGLVSFLAQGGFFPEGLRPADVPALLVYCILPGFGTLHFVYMARRYLFFPSAATQP